MRFKYRLFAALLIFCAAFSARSADSDSILDTLAGQWIDVDKKYCDIAQTTISVSDDRSSIDFVHSSLGQATATDIRKRFTYRVGKQRGNRLHLDLEDETRLDEQGHPVSWDLVLLSPDEFCWNRSDWPEDGCTTSVFRCEG